MKESSKKRRQRSPMEVSDDIIELDHDPTQTVDVNEMRVELLRIKALKHDERNARRG